MIIAGFPVEGSHHSLHSSGFHLYEIAFSRGRAGRDLFFFWNGVMSRLWHLYTGELEGQGLLGEHGRYISYRVAVQRGFSFLSV